MTRPIPLTTQIKQKVHQLGFDWCKAIPLETPPHAPFFGAWLAEGRAGEMTYLERNVNKRRDPQLLAESGTPPFQSMLVLAVNHFQFQLPPNLRDDPSYGIIASYAWGDDYHEIIRPLLYELDSFIRHQTGRTTQGKGLVDTGPVLERDWAQRAGIGFTGKNCCTIHPIQGSWIFLATLLIPEVLVYDPIPKPISAHQPTPPPTELPLSSDELTTSQSMHAPSPSHIDVLNGLPPQKQYGSWTVSDRMVTCGRCTRCLDSCPTDAFVGPFHLDPQHCISYWTIESKQVTPRSLRSSFGNRIFGCDICQEVCPWNQRLGQRTPLLQGLEAQAERVAIPLIEGFEANTPYWLEQEAFSRRFRRSPIKRGQAPRYVAQRLYCVGELGRSDCPRTAATGLNR